MGIIMEAYENNKDLLQLHTKDEDEYLGIVIVDEDNDYIIIEDVMSHNEISVIAKSNILYIGAL